MKITLKKPIQSAQICLFIFCLALGAAAQNTLARFEKSIDEGNFAVEKELFSYVIANSKDAKGFLLLAKLRLKQNRLGEAKSLSQKALALEGNLLSAKLMLASAHFQLGESKAARDVLNGISDADLADDATRLNLAQTFVEVGDCPKALVLTEKLSPKVKNGEALPLRANCYLKTGERKNFEALIPIARTLIKPYPKTVVGFAEILSDAGMHRETADLLRAVVTSSTKNAAALVLLAKSEIYLKDFSNAEMHLAAAEKLEPGSAPLLFAKALLESERGESKKALDLLEKALAASPHDTRILGQLVVAAMRANYTSKAMRAAEKLLELKPDDLDYLYLYGAASLQNKNLPAAESALAKFLESRPLDPRACVALGLTFAAQPDKLDIAREQMRKCLTLNPDNTEAAYQLGLSYKAAGDATKAIEHLETAVRISPDYASALRDLGTVYLQNGMETNARPVLEKAAALNPKDADTHFQLSRLYNLLGERELAKKHLDIFQALRNPKKEGM